MWTADTILEFLRQHRQILYEMGVRKIGLFGSYARGEQRPGNDTDLLVVMQDSRFKPCAKVWNFLEDSFGGKVDLVREELRPAVMLEVRYVEEHYP